MSRTAKYTQYTIHLLFLVNLHRCFSINSEVNANEEGGKVGYEVSEGARLHFIKFETRQIEKVSAHYLIPRKIAVKWSYLCAETFISMGYNFYSLQCLDYVRKTLMPEQQQQQQQQEQGVVVR